VQTARRDVERLRERLTSVESLVESSDVDSDAASAASTRQLEEIARTGVVPIVGNRSISSMGARLEIARQLFLTWPDITSLLVLMVVCSGRNVETIKELPAEHRVLEGRAVELQVVKRRRGAGRWSETVTWEVGPPHRELHTAGGMYLLVHRLAARSRAFSGGSGLWALWRNSAWGSEVENCEHVDPFSGGLHKHSYYVRDWHPEGLPPASSASGESSSSLVGASDSPRLDFNRLRKSVEVRRTKHLGGHLPSAARSNSTEVLFASYLRDDPSTIEWSQSVVGEAFVEAEAAALESHRQSLLAAGGRTQLEVRRALSEESELEQTAWTGCMNPDAHPTTGRTCEASFLDCFNCGNCVISHNHLPRLLDLLDALRARRQECSDQEWWVRYGAALAAIRHDVLPRFTAEELTVAAQSQTRDALLDIVEDPWEHP
jgi:hypothetical protein